MLWSLPDAIMFLFGTCCLSANSVIIMLRVFSAYSVHVIINYASSTDTQRLFWADKLPKLSFSVINTSLLCDFMENWLTFGALVCRSAKHVTRLTQKRERKKQNIIIKTVRMNIYLAMN